MDQTPPKPLKERVGDFVKWLFEGSSPYVPRDAKVINDSLLGNQFFAKHEVAVIDSPILQRLKKIKHTGLVYHVFPSATHSRFEHSLGAVTLAERCFNAIKDRFSVEFRQEQFPANPDRFEGDLAHLRMAALLHDVGHGLCSHASEQIYANLTDLREFRNDPAYAKNSPGEVLSYLIITSKTFRKWFEETVRGGCRADIDLETVANMVLGKHDDPERYFLAQIVSSPYDADKLDYIARDSYYCGIALTVDLPRFYSTISISKINKHRVLVLRSYVPVEQIFFNKMTLFGSVYHHQKVKCLDSMLRSLIQHITENSDQCSVEIRGQRIAFSEPVQYLYPTDDEFFNQFDGFGDEFVLKMLDRFRRRDLFVRCLELSRTTVNNWDAPERKHLINLSSDGATLGQREAEIHRCLPSAIRSICNLGEVRLSVPEVPSLRSDYAYIQTRKESDPKTIEEFFPVEQWIDSYSHSKWKSFVYAPREYAEQVRDAAISVFRDKGIDINKEASDRACRVP